MKLRLQNHRIAHQPSASPSQVVARLGAMQAQDFASVKWAIGLRCQNSTEAEVEQAIADRSIVRTWLMRGTLHVVAAHDVRWMLALLGPRLIAQSARRYRQLELDEDTFARVHATLDTRLANAEPTTRAEVLAMLDRAGIATDGQRGYHILRRAGLDGLICFGPMQDGQETFVLLDDWAEQGQSLARDAALAELASRYFSSHGPATLQDFAWWSGLTLSDARAAIEGASTGLAQLSVDDGQAYWWNESEPESPESEASSPTAHLLPAYDEYYLGYRERGLILDAKFDATLVSHNGVFRPTIVIDGQVVGIWRVTRKHGAVSLRLEPFEALADDESHALSIAADRYGAFLGLPISLIQE